MGQLWCASQERHWAACDHVKDRGREPSPTLPRTDQGGDRQPASHPADNPANKPTHQRIAAKPTQPARIPNQQTNHHVTHLVTTHHLNQTPIFSCVCAQCSCLSSSRSCRQIHLTRHFFSCAVRTLNDVHSHHGSRMCLCASPHSLCSFPCVSPIPCSSFSTSTWTLT